MSVDTADLPAGVVNTLGGVSQVFTVASGDDENGGDFGYYRPGSIGDFVWDDLDGDGVFRRRSSRGSPRSTVTLTGPGIPPGTTDTTDASGFYGFPGLAPGSYSVQVDTASLPLGAVSTTGGFTAAGVVDHVGRR